MGRKPADTEPGTEKDWIKRSLESHLNHEPTKYTQLYPLFTKDRKTLQAPYTIRYCFDESLAKGARVRAYPGTETNWKVLAGLLHLENTFQARQWLASPMINTVLDNFRKVYKVGKCFGKVPNPTMVYAAVSDIWERVHESRTQYSRLDFLRQLPENKLLQSSDIQKLGDSTGRAVPETEWSLYIILFAMLAVMRIDPSRFPKSMVRPSGGAMKLDPDDMFAMFWILKQWMSQKAKGAFDPAHWGVDGTKHSRIPNSNACTIVYYTENLGDREEVDDQLPMDPEASNSGRLQPTEDETEVQVIERSTEYHPKGLHTLRAEAAARDLFVTRDMANLREQKAGHSLTTDQDLKKEASMLKAYHHKTAALKLLKIKTPAERLQAAEKLWSLVESRFDLPAHLESLGWNGDIMESARSMQDTAISGLAQEEDLSGAEKASAGRFDFAEQTDLDASDPHARRLEYRARLTRMSGGVSMPTPSVKDAQSRYFPEESDRDLLGYKLLPHQMTGVAAAVDAWKNGQHGMIIQDACGLGKTITFLTMALKIAHLWNDQHPNGPYYPIFIGCPVGVLRVWIDEIYNQFGDKFAYYAFYPAGAKNKTDVVYLSNRQLLDGLFLPGGHFDQDDARTSTSIILCPYSTWNMRTLMYAPTYKKTRDKMERHLTEGKPFPPTLSLEGKIDRILSITKRLDYACAVALIGKRTGLPTDAGRKIQKERGGHGQDSEGNEEEADEDDEIDGDDPAATAEWDQLMQDEGVISIAAHRFGIVAFDEAQHLKNRNTRRNVSVRLLRPRIFTVCISATLLSNSAYDFVAILELIQPKKTASQDAIQFDGLEDLITKVYENSDRPAADKLDIDMYRTLVNTSRGGIDVNTAARVIPIIQRICCLRRMIGDSVELPDGKTEHIGQDIPPAHTFFLRVLPGEEERHWLQQSWRDHAPYLFRASPSANKKLERKANFRDPSKGGSMNFEVWRKLEGAAFVPKIRKVRDRFNTAHSISKGGDSTAGDQLNAVTGFAAREDSGIWLVLHALIEDSNIRPEIFMSSPEHLLDFIGRQMPKIRALVGILAYHVLRREQKVVILTEVPLHNLFVEHLLEVLGIPFKPIHSTMSQDERAENIARFNDPDDKTAMVMDANSLLIGVGMNIHKACHTLVIMEPQQNLAWTGQIMGRIIRVGQRHTQYIYYICCDLSVEEKVYSRNIEKYMPIILGGMDPTDPRYKAKLEHILATDLFSDMDGYTNDSDIRRQANAILARRRITEEFGIPFDCLNPITNNFADIGINNGDARILTARERQRNLDDFQENKTEFYQREYSFNTLDSKTLPFVGQRDDVPRTPPRGALYGMHPATPSSIVKGTKWQTRDPTSTWEEEKFVPRSYIPPEPSGKGQHARFSNFQKRSTAKSSRCVHSILHQEKIAHTEPGSHCCVVCTRDSEVPPFDDLSLGHNCHRLCPTHMQEVSSRARYYILQEHKDDPGARNITDHDSLPQIVALIERKTLLSVETFLYKHVITDLVFSCTDCSKTASDEDDDMILARSEKEARRRQDQKTRRAERASKGDSSKGRKQYKSADTVESGDEMDLASDAEYHLQNPKRPRVHTSDTDDTDSPRKKRKISQDSGKIHNQSKADSDSADVFQDILATNDSDLIGSADGDNQENHQRNHSEPLSSALDSPSKSSSTSREHSTERSTKSTLPAQSNNRSASPSLSSRSQHSSTAGPPLIYTPPLYTTAAGKPKEPNAAQRARDGIAVVAVEEHDSELLNFLSGLDLRGKSENYFERLYNDFLANMGP